MHTLHLGLQLRSSQFWDPPSPKNTTLVDPHSILHDSIVCVLGLGVKNQYNIV